MRDAVPGNIASRTNVLLPLIDDREVRIQTPAVAGTQLRHGRTPRTREKEFRIVHGRQARMEDGIWMAVDAVGGDSDGGRMEVL